MIKDLLIRLNEYTEDPDAFETESERVMQKCGFIKEAEHIDYEWQDGKMKNRLEYRLLKKEWPKD